jgi:L,D-transpeptidase YcbB
VNCVGRIAAVTWMLAASPVYDPRPISSSQDAASELRRLVDSGVLPDLRWPEFSAYRHHVKSFYGNSQYALAWTRDGRPTFQAQAVIEALRTAVTKGLDPADYDGALWPLRVLQLHKGSTSQRDLARFDLALTISVMRHISDLHIGKVNPKLFHIRFDLAHENYDLANLLRERLINATDAQAVLDSVDPPFDGYRRTQKALQRYLGLAARADTEPLPQLKKPLEPDGSYSGIPKLTRLLLLLGDLPAGTAQSVETDVYYPALVDAVKRFQTRHGLEADGRIGADTFRQLNTPLARRVRQLQLTLERWRWVPHAFPQPPIVVNIPEFRLRALNNSYLTGLDMKVVVGKAYRHRTPVFAAELKHVIFRPYWNVPLSIVRAELLPVLARKRTHESDFQIVTPEGTVVMERPVSDRTLSQLRSGKLLLRQTPGAKNALGRVKFIFPNDNNVYLHDTPTQHLFAKPRRDFSHGCIRVEKPQALAEWVLRNDPEWSPERVTAAMNGTATVQVNVKPAIPVLIVYATAVAIEGGDVRFFEDIYGHDTLLEAQLARTHP